MKHILIIDDEGQIRKAMKEILEKEGYGVTVAANGREGVELFKKRPVDLIITDIIMPEKAGLETIAEIKKENTQVKIIAISGGGRVSSKDYLVWAEKMGASRTFAKPIDFGELLKAVAALLAV